MRLKGGDLVVEILKQEGVEIIFGYPGGMALPLYDSLYDCGIRHILTRHEQGAVHAADGYARATGKVGVCIATSGPGAANLITGIATANMDSVPLVCITCQVTLAQLGKDSFQEADISGITTPITKHNFMVKTASLLPGILHKAFHIARTGRPGPVVIDIPKDIFTMEIELEAPEFSTRGYHPPYAGDMGQIEAVAAALAQAERPLIMAGGGMVNAGLRDTLTALVRKTGVPFTTTLMGLSAAGGEARDYYLGMPGMHGIYAANMAISHCDLLIGLGCRFDDRVTGNLAKFAPQAQIAHFDIDASEIGKLVPVKFRVLADLRWSAPALLEQASHCATLPWLKQIRGWQEEHPLSFDQGSAAIKPQEVFLAVNRQLADDAFIVTDVGQHQMWAAQYAEVKRLRGFLSSGGLGTMGFGLPAALGAQLGHPEAEVWLFVGDGGIMMNCQEIATAVEHQLPLKIVVLNNHGLGMVRQWQRLFFGGRMSGSKHYAGTDFSALAKAMGAEGIKVERREDLDNAILAAKRCPGPMLLDICVEDDENVLPMVAPAAALTEMITN